jgi:hypothetical protein
MFTLRWTTAAVEELTSFWRGANEARRAALEWAITDLDYRLSRYPHEEGESRPGGYRVTFSWPLAILFAIEHDPQIVRIYHAWTYRR